MANTALEEAIPINANLPQENLKNKQARTMICTNKAKNELLVADSTKTNEPETNPIIGRKMFKRYLFLSIFRTQIYFKVLFIYFSGYSTRLAQPQKLKEKRQMPPHTLNSIMA